MKVYILSTVLLIALFWGCERPDIIITDDDLPVELKDSIEEVVEPDSIIEPDTEPEQIILINRFTKFDKVDHILLPDYPYDFEVLSDNQFLYLSHSNYHFIKSVNKNGATRVWKDADDSAWLFSLDEKGILHVMMSDFRIAQFDSSGNQINIIDFENLSDIYKGSGFGFTVYKDHYFIIMGPNLVEMDYEGTLLNQYLLPFDKDLFKLDPNRDPFFDVSDVEVMEEGKFLITGTYRRTVQDNNNNSSDAIVKIHLTTYSAKTDECKTVIPEEILGMDTAIANRPTISKVGDYYAIATGSCYSIEFYDQDLNKLTSIEYENRKDPQKVKYFDGKLYVLLGSFRKIYVYEF